MGRKPSCSKLGLNRGAWTPEEDKVLIGYIKTNGEGKWSRLPQRTGLKRCGKSCRFRWMNYLKPEIKRGNISQDEEELIIRLHNLLGNRWSLIAGRLPGRTDNEIKNYWNSTLLKKLNNGRLINQKNKQSSLQFSPSSSPLPSVESNVRTKASRSSMLFKDSDHLHINSPALQTRFGLEAIHDGSYEFLQSGFEEDDPRWNFATGFDPDDLCLSDLLNAD